MKRTILVLFAVLFLSVSLYAQNRSGGPSAPASNTSSDKTPRKAIFRPNKDQIKQVQTILKTRNLYIGDATGKLDPTTRTSIKSYQKDNGLRQTGTLNRATLEKMGIELTAAQKSIPVSPNSFASSDNSRSDSGAKKADGKPKRTIFRATKDQIVSAQKLLKSKSMYTGEETGKLDDATREGLKKFQTASGLKVTGTLNQVTLEKMGIELTERQKGTAATNK